MEFQTQEMVEKLMREGVDAAMEEASRIKSQAEAEAKRIVDTAKREAETIVSRGKADAERSEKAGIAAIGQASRNLVLAFKGEVQALLDKIIAQEASSAFSGDVLKESLPGLVKGWASGAESLDVILPEGELRTLNAYFQDKLAAEFKQGLELKPDRNLAAGFRIANKDGSAYYDFSADAVVELLSAYLNPRLAEILKASAKGI